MAKKYAYTYLNKAKKEQDSIKRANGYYFLSRLYFKQNIPLCLKFADSAIIFSKKNSTEHLPYLAYINKASYNYIHGNLENSLENYVYANEAAIKVNNIEAQHNVKYYISVLKNRLGDYRESIELSKGVMLYFEKQNRKTGYLDVIFSLASSYSKFKLSDSSTYFNKLGYKKSIEFKDTLMQNYFILNEGINQISKNNYKVALDSILKSTPKITEANDIANIIISKYYTGLAYNKLGNIDKSIIYLKEMDSLLVNSGEIIQEARNGYEILIDYYKSENKIDDQLFYIDRLIKFDSINYDSYRKLSTVISKKYDTRLLIQEKNELKEKLDLASTNEKSYKWKILLLIIVIIICCFLVYHNYQKRLVYERRFEELINNSQVEQQSIQNTEITKPPLTIPDEIIKSILAKLDVFESDHKYLEKEINRETLANKFGTNTKYISKIINHYKNKSFRDYINDLRVQYAVKTLKENKNLRKYTIKSIADELGYKSVDSFSKAFRKNTGMQVSYFIKKLNVTEGNL
ncbi:helix-turn-helix domain-containing protein [Kordia sp.]|uniref:helix-turn-helix domain-containing protein n=1 Tax=Kordia sp. TaxID=1965332 RepID=UPI003D26B62F